MREAYHDQLEQLADRLADMTGMVAEAMENATTALLQADLGLAEQVISGDQKVDDVRSSIEEHRLRRSTSGKPIRRREPPL